jgi:hypothetical protein
MLKEIPLKSALSLLVAGFLACTGSVRAETHALIMTIGSYKAPVIPLLGVKHDVQSARTIAERMGVAARNMRVYSDDQLTLEGMRQAFNELDQRVAPGDQVFVYFSGHGTRMRVSDPVERCSEALVTVDNQAFTDNEMEAMLKRLSDKAQKIVALLDAARRVPFRRGRHARRGRRGGEPDREVRAAQRQGRMRAAGEHPDAVHRPAVAYAGQRREELRLHRCCPRQRGLIRRGGDWRNCDDGMA